MQSLPVLKASYNDDFRRVKLSSCDFESLQIQISQFFSLDKESFVMKYKDDEGDLISIFTNEELMEALQFNQKVLRIYVTLKNQPKRKILKKKVKRNNKAENNNSDNNNNINVPGFRDILNNPNVDPFAFIQPICQNILKEGKIEEIIQNVLSNDYSGTIDQFLPFFSKTNPNDENSQPIVPEKVVHHAFCDRCDQRISGIRWKCFECDDFDYCNDCYNIANGKEDKKGHLKTHVFGKIENLCNSNFHQEKENHLDKLRVDKENQEKQRLEKEKLEKERLEKERLEKESQEKQRLEKLKLIEEENKIVYPFEQKLDDLQNMGFSDRKKNIQILIKYKGSINHAIQELLDSN